jgi:hypothetical protein
MGAPASKKVDFLDAKCGQFFTTFSCGNQNQAFLEFFPEKSLKKG